MVDFVLGHISIQGLMWLSIALPLFGFVLNSIFALMSTKYRYNEPRGLIVTISTIVPFMSLFAVFLVWYVLQQLEGAVPSVITGPLFSWNGFLNRPLEFGLKADQLSLSLALLLSFIGSFVHLYSIGFLEKEKHISSYFALLNLIFSLSLVLLFVDSFFFFFVVWQILGLLGFLIIIRRGTGETRFRDAKVYYTIEMFAGAAFLLLLFLIWKSFELRAGFTTNIFQFSSIQIGSAYLVAHADVVCLVLLISVVVRTVQFPLYVWLPRVTKVPIPVFLYMFILSSSVISIYLLIRLNYLLILAPRILNVISVLGVLAVLFGAFSALIQKELKKIIGYLSIFNVGLVFIAIGIGAFSTALFQLILYSIYLSAIVFGLGGVIAATGTDSIHKLGGLKKMLPVTFWTTFTGVLAASAIYPFSGFFGINGVLWETYQRGHGFLFLFSFIGIIVMVVSLFKMIGLVFYGKKAEGTKQAQETSVSMLITMLIMAFVSFVIGWISVSVAFGGDDLFRNWIGQGLAMQVIHVVGEQGSYSEFIIAIVTTVAAVYAGIVTWIIYSQKRKWAASLSNKFPKLNSLLENGFYIDAFYSKVVGAPARWVSKKMVSEGCDKLLVDGLFVSFPGRFLELINEVLCRWNVRNLKAYIFWIVLGLLIVVGWSIY